MFRWLSGRGARQRDVVQRLAQITDTDWQHTLDTLPFLAGLDAAQSSELRLRTAWLLASKSFSGARGMVLTDDILLCIATQAALPILALNTAWYEGWTEIIVYPDDFLIPRTDADESGVVHEYVQEASGEAWEGGPVLLSWQAANPHNASPANVVIHEFAHKLDAYGGETDGMPILSGTGISARLWRQVQQDAFDAFDQALTDVEDAIPHDVDPESEAAAPWYDALPLDPYAATDLVEFFAVSSEAFFVDPYPLAEQLPDWYGLLSRYYRQDPLARLQAIAAPSPSQP